MTKRKPLPAIRTFRQRQLALAICCRMPPRVACEVMGIAISDYYKRVTELLEATGMATVVEFAVQQKAAVRRLMHGEE